MPREKNGHHAPWQWRYFASNCFYRNSGNIIKATADFRSILGDKVTRASEFIEKWSEPERALAGWKDEPRSGKPSKLSEEDALRAGEIYKQVYKEHRKFRRYLSMRQAIELSPELKNICKVAGIKPAQLCVRVEKANEKLAERKKQERSEKQKIAYRKRKLQMQKEKAKSKKWFVACVSFPYKRRKLSRLMLLTTS